MRKLVSRRGRQLTVVAPSAVLSLMLMSTPAALFASVTPQDTVIIRADNEPVWGARIEVEEDLRIGMLAGPDEYVFGRVGRIAVGLDSSIFVYDGHVPIVRQYDDHGEFVRNVGIVRICCSTSKLFMDLPTGVW